jgi:hypothetical protein
MRRSNIFYLIACAVAAVIPFAPAQTKHSSTAATGFPGWPAQFESRALTALPLTEFEQRFASDFPGKIGRFTDGKREIIIRWVTGPTRMLHPASDCFQGLGYTVKPLPVRRDEQGSLWSSFAASKGNERLRVYERIHSDAGESWTDVSAWYWAALQEGSGSWWAVTIAEKSVQSVDGLRKHD